MPHDIIYTGIAAPLKLYGIMQQIHEHTLRTAHNAYFYTKEVTKEW